MKISLNWLRKYVKIDVPDDELVRLIGARLVEVEGVIDEQHKYDNIVVAKVVKAEKIPDTHLTLCQVDAGASELVQVVCGAPNVREGMLAVWIKPGATVPASVHEDAPFVIGKRKMLGKYDSNGMLAGSDELDFGDDHSGIVEINPEEAKPGDALAEIFDLTDLIFEIENKSLTHRPDCFGIIGFAREVAGILGEKFDYNSLDLARTRSSLRGSLGRLSSRDISIHIESPAICSRYSAVVLEKHGEMKKKYLTWQDTVLAKSGMKPISPIVDATNYLMLLTGQPLHAFDYDKFVLAGGGKRADIVVRLAKNGEKLLLLDQTEVALNENDIVICSGDTPVALAGAMGGFATAIDENTKNIILESATFSLYNLRKTQMAHGIFTEAITRFTKGQPPYQTLDVAEACASELSEGFKVTSVIDEYPNPEKDVVIKVSIDEINQLLGTDYNKELIVRTLENVGFFVKEKRGTFEIEAPEWRTDIHIKEDIIEEVGRLLGYDNIEPTLPLHKTAIKNEMMELKRFVRCRLSSLGANEVLTYSFISQRILERATQNPDNSYKIINSISPDLQFVRQSLIPSLLEKTYLNEKLPVEKFAIFEMNKVYQKEWGMNEEGVPVEKMNLAIVIAERKNNETAFYKAKLYVDRLLKDFNIDVKYEPLKNNRAETMPFEKKRSAEILTSDGEYLGVVGEFKNSVRSEFKLAPYLAGAEIDLGMVLSLKNPKKKIDFRAKKIEDLTVETDETYDKALLKVRKQYPGTEILPRSIYQPEGGKKRITFRIVSYLD